MDNPEFICWDGFEEISSERMLENTSDFYQRMQKRRSVRTFSDRPVAREIIEQCLGTAGTAPSGANKQPWHFGVVTDQDLKQSIRTAAESKERLFYEKIRGSAWERDLKTLGTGIEKPFLTQAPYLVVVFAQPFTRDFRGRKDTHYYVTLSVGLALGLFITAVHQAHLACLVYTPAPMDFLNELLHRPPHERALCICPVGYPAADALVPRQSRKPLNQVVSWY